MLLLPRNSGLLEVYMANVEDAGLQSGKTLTLVNAELATLSQSNLFPKMRKILLGVLLSSPNEDRIRKPEMIKANKSTYVALHGC